MQSPQTACKVRTVSQAANDVAGAPLACQSRAFNESSSHCWHGMHSMACCQFYCLMVKLPQLQRRSAGSSNHWFPTVGEPSLGVPVHSRLLVAWYAFSSVSLSLTSSVINEKSILQPISRWYSFRNTVPRLRAPSYLNTSDYTTTSCTAWSTTGHGGNQHK